MELTLDSGRTVKVSMLGHADPKPLVVPIVGPGGEFQEVVVNRFLKEPGLTMVNLYQGELVLTTHAKNKGYCLYHDMCLGVVEGVVAKPVFWTLYKRVVRMREDGARPARGALPASKKYHPEVNRRRREVKNGVRVISEDAIDAMIKEVREGEKDIPEGERARLRKVHQELGLEADKLTTEELLELAADA